MFLASLIIFTTLFRTVTLSQRNLILSSIKLNLVKYIHMYVHLSIFGCIIGLRT